jgi:cytochrome c oxidase subunit IV
MVQQTGSMPALDEHHEEGHPGLGTYVNIAIFLAIITGIEVAIYYVEALDAILVPALIILSAVKFVTVVGFFMHLKFDGKLLSFIFGAALIVAIAVYVAMDMMMDHRAVNVFYGGQ